MRRNRYVQMIATVLAILLLTLVSGCVSTGKTYVGKNLALAQGEPAGWVVASIGVKRDAERTAPYTGYNLRLRAANAAKNDHHRHAMLLFLAHDIFSEKGVSELDVAQDGVFASVQAIALPPGDYSLMGGRMSTDTGFASEWVEALDLDLRFTVAADQVTYLGSFLGRSAEGKNVLGMTVRAGAFYEVHDEMERDIAIWRRKSSASALPERVAPALFDFPKEPPLFFVPIAR